MDKLSAYKVLQLLPGSSVEEIKEAYAVLSRQFHPEEYPEEFQEIHEAYTTLVCGSRRRGKGTRSSQYVEEVREKAEQRKEERKYGRSVQDAKNVRGEKQEKSTYDFEAIIKRAEREEAERGEPERQILVQALNEFQILLQPEYREKLKLFKFFFTKEAYAEVVKTEEFIGELAELLENSRLKKGIYDYIIKFYGLLGNTVEQMNTEKAALYHVVDKKRGMKAKEIEEIVYALLIVYPVGMQIAKYMEEEAQDRQMFGTIALCVAAIAVVVWIYQKVHENHSSILSQAIIAVGIAISQFFVIMTEFYGTAFGSMENGVLVATCLLTAALIWLGVLFVVSMIFKRKHT